MFADCGIWWSNRTLLCLFSGVAQASKDKLRSVGRLANYFPMAFSVLAAQHWSSIALASSKEAGASGFKE